LVTRTKHLQRNKLYK